VRVELYSLYQRVWHWLQAFVILGLLWTGLGLHNPGLATGLAFETALRVHIVLGVALIANAVLGLFYHLTTGRLREYVPEPQDFFSLAFRQAKYYLHGIFRGAPHPFQRRPGRKLNPLQQVTYLAILNLLLPLQAITGVLLWAAPAGIAIGTLGPVHTLGAWLFGAFLILHVYLTTTGPTPTAHLRTMIVGWEEEEH
jgi:thiosulfate reductase cytochrome b subunit